MPPLGAALSFSHICQIDHSLLAYPQKPEGGYDHANPFQNTACAGLVAARCAETRVQARGSSGGICALDRRSAVARI